MSREWNPGDVASVLFRGTQTAFRTTEGWTYIDGSTNGTRADEHDMRPLVVIDPEDAQQAFRLVRLFWAHSTDDGDDLEAMQAALREFAQPTPPRPAEPTGLGAVVEDEDGALWVKWTVAHRADRNWKSEKDSGDYRTYSDVAAVRVLSEGV